VAKNNFEGSGRKRLGLTRIIVFMVIVAAGTIFVLQNRVETIQLHVFSHYFYPRIIWFALAVFAVGVVFGFIFGRLTKRSGRGSS
jgi:hypothetical protein